MSKHTLFLVHGMGSYVGTPWGNEVWDKLVECSQRYPHFASTPLDTYAEPVPILYNDTLARALARWDRHAQSFGEFATANALPEAGSLNWLTGIARDDAGFLLTHVADVVIYRFFAYERAQIRTTVLHEIYSAVDQRRLVDRQAKFSVLAHSLGTAVSHDALAEIGSAPMIEGHTNAYTALNFKFESIHMLANVGRILQTSPKVYDSCVRPGPDNSKDRCCLRMFSHRHALDPFTRPKPFQPVGWGNRFTQTPDLNHYRGWNVHGWLHYLDHPRVHIPLLRSISKQSAITNQQEQEAVSNYRQFGSGLAQIDVAKQTIEQLHRLIGRIDVERGLEENFATIRQIATMLDNLRESAGQTWRDLEGSFS